MVYIRCALVTEKLFSLLKVSLLFLFVLFSTLFTVGNNHVPSEFRTINISDGLSHNTINTIYKDNRGFVWIGTQLGLDRFDGINIVNYPQLKEYSVFSVCENDSVFLWIGTDKGLFRLDRRIEKMESIYLDEDVLVVKSILPISKEVYLVGSSGGLFIVDDETVEKVNLGVDALSQTNYLSGIIKGEDEDIYWIVSNNGLIRFDLETKNIQVYKHPENNPNLNNYSCLTLLGDKLYIGTRNAGVLVFDTGDKQFVPFSYSGNAYITAILPANESELYVGTDGGGLNRISAITGEIIENIKYEAGERGISSNAVYSFLKDGNSLWIGTYMGGLNYTPAKGNKFHVYSSGTAFNSKRYNVRSFWIVDNGDKIIGTREGLIYVSEGENTVLTFSSQNSRLTADIILSVYPLSNQDFLIGTYGGGLYLFNSSTKKIQFFRDEEDFRKGSFYNIIKDGKGNIWLSSSHGVYCYNTIDNTYIHYNNTNSGLKDNTVFCSFIDSGERIWFGAVGSVCVYNPATGVFSSDVFPSHFLPFTKSVRYIYEDSEQNIWFCDNKEGVVKADKNFVKFEHFTNENFSPAGAVMSIVEDETGTLWFATQRGLLSWSLGEDSKKFYSLYDGIPGYIFNTPVQQTEEAIWWGNEQGLVYYYKAEQETNIGDDNHNYPVITSISVAGNVLRIGDKLLPQSPVFTSDIHILEKSSIELTFSTLDYSQEDTGIYEYMLEGYDTEWRFLMKGNKVLYPDLSKGQYVFKVRSGSAPDKITALNIYVNKEMSLLIWLIFVCVVVVVILLLFYSRLLIQYRQIKENIIVKKEKMMVEKYSRVRMDEKVVDSIKEKLLQYMQEEKPFLNPDLKLQDVSNAIGCNYVELSKILNVHLNVNFTDFINQYRIEEFITQAQNKSAVRYTLTALSEKSGFSSRTSFFRSFKKIKGKTPAEYLKECGIELEK